MGKAIIIKGADFGAVAVSAEPVVQTSRWLLGFSDEQISLTASGSSFFKPSSPDDIAYAFTEGADTALIGKTIKKVKFYATNTGTLKLCRVDRENFAFDCIQTIEVTSKGVVTMDLTTPFKVDSTHTIGIMYTDTAATKYMNSVDNGYQFVMINKAAKTVGTSVCAFIIDYAY